MSEDAPAMFKRMLREIAAPALREHGLRGSGQTYMLPDAAHWAQVGFQKSTASTAEVVKFTINLKVTAKDWWDDERRDHSPFKDVPPPGVDRESWDAQRLKESSYPLRPSANTSGDGRTIRIGRLIPGIEADHWWSLTTTNMEQVVRDALHALIQYGLPWLRAEVGGRASS